MDKSLQQYIKLVVRGQHQGSQSIEQDPLSSPSSPRSPSVCCKLCYDATVTTIVQPCHHAVACRPCIEQCQFCPVCRQSIERIDPVFW
jgi:hypothetical protein